MVRVPRHRGPFLSMRLFILICVPVAPRLLSRVREHLVLLFRKFMLVVNYPKFFQCIYAFT